MQADFHHGLLRAAPRGGTPDGLRRGHPRGRPGDVAGNRAVSRSTRFTTAGAPDRRDLPGGEGHVRRCGPGKRGAKHPLIRRPMQRPRGDAVTGRLAGRAWAARDVAGGRARGAGAGPAVRASGGAEARGTDVVPARPWPDGGEVAASGAPPNWSSVIAVDAPGERGIRCVPWTRTASVAPGGQAPRNGASILDSARGLGIRDAQVRSGCFALASHPLRRRQGPFAPCHFQVSTGGAPFRGAPAPARSRGPGGAAGAGHRPSVRGGSRPGP